MSEVAAAEATLRVIAVSSRHQQRAQVGITNAELPVVACRTPMASVGKSAKQIEMSIAVITNSTACSNALASNVSSSLRNLSRLRLARLHELCPSSCTHCRDWMR